MEMQPHDCDYRSLLEQTPAITYLADHDEDYTLRYMSPQIEALLGYPVARFLEASDFWIERVHPEDRERVNAEAEAAIAEVRGLDLEYRMVSRDGRVVWMWERTAILYGAGGAPEAVQGVMVEITSLKDAEAREAAILDAAMDAIIAIDADGLVVEFNPAAERIFGRRREDAIGLDMADLIIPPELRDAHRAGLQRLVSGGEPKMLGRRLNLVALRADGSEFPAELTITRLQTGGRPQFTGQLRDITDRVRADEALRAEHERAERYLDMAGTMMVALDRDRRVSLVNRKASAVLGYEVEELLGRDWHDTVVPEHDRARARSVFSSLIAGGEGPPEASEGRVRTRAGEERLIAWKNTAIRDPDGTITGTLSSGEDITERRRAEARIAHLAYHDGLTGLANRMQLEEHLGRALARADRAGTAVALLYVDLDDFKLVNDSFGHAAGDEVLQAVARRMERTLRATDVLARHGGDEFLVLLSDLGDEPLAAARTVAHKLVAALREPFALAGLEFQIDATVGISLYPDDADSADALLRHADTAMYDGKGAGSVAVYAGGAADPRGRLSMTRRLHHALEHGELELHYQPVVTLADRATVGAEALLRWRDPQNGLVPPGDFLGVAEETGLIEPIGDWVVEALCRQARAWQDEGIDLQLAFNVSLRQLRPQRFAGMLERALAEHDLDPGRITAEITESATMREPARVEHALHELNELGVQLAIDDFGAGYSSLGRLQRMPVDILKIDRSFLSELPAGGPAAAVVGTIVQLASALGMEAVAEGVETELQRELLLERGCRLSQGYLFGRPMPAPDLTALLASRPAPTAPPRRRRSAPPSRTAS
jgi:diguanylate cyclase (GGDEF)-like protein/PAS domain S-box-containing protein